MVQQSALNIVAPIKPGAKEPLKAVLQTMNADVAGNPVIPFGRLPLTHFARLVVIDETTDPDGRTLPAALLFASDFDGPLDRYLEDLLRRAGAGLDQLFGHCVDYPTGTVTHAARRAYLQAHSLPTGAFYVNTAGRTVQQIRNEAQLREAIEEFLDRAGPDLLKLDPVAIRAAIRRYVAGQKSLQWIRQRSEPTDLAWQVQDTLHLIGVPLLLLALAPLLLLILPAWLVLLRVHELTDPAPDIPPDPAHVRELTDLEDHLALNQFNAIGFSKPGLFRWLTIRFLLLLVGYGTRHILNRGDLTGVKTIHFARWVFLNENRLIFMSNYDGSLESYMDDFIDKVAWGLNAVFSNGIGYPKTNWLILDGAKNEQVYKHYIRCHQIPSQVWYAPYGNLTASNIANNARIRAGLYGRMDAAAAAEWLRLL